MPETLNDKVVSKGTLTLLDIRTIRDRDGVRVLLKSDVDWLGRLKLPGESLPRYHIGGLKAHATREPRPRCNTACVWNYQHELYANDGSGINATVLMIPGLRDGIELRFAELPMSAEQLKKYPVDMKALVSELYILYFRPVDIACRVEAKEVDNYAAAVAIKAKNREVES